MAFTALIRTRSSGACQILNERPAAGRIRILICRGSRGGVDGEAAQIGISGCVTGGPSCRAACVREDCWQSDSRLQGGRHGRRLLGLGATGSS